MKNISKTIGAFVAASALSTAAFAAPVTLPLDPGHSRVGLTGYAFGLSPTSGQFNEYSGSLTIDPENINSCNVDMTLQSKTVVMSMPMVTSMVLAQDFLDPAKYPTLVFHGTCKANPGALPTLSGTLTMHGETHPFDMKVAFANQILTTVGTLDRTQWHVTGDPNMIGKNVKVSVTVRLPDSMKFTNLPQ